MAERLEDVLATWYEARDSGTPQDPADCIAAHPDLADELRVHFELMETIDQAKSQVAEAEETFRQLESSAPGQLEEIGKRQAHFEAEHAKLLSRRGDEIVGIEAQLLARYERIAVKHKPAVVVMPANICPRCQMAVPAQRVSEIKRSVAVHACGGCQRLLVCPDALKAG